MRVDVIYVARRDLSGGEGAAHGAVGTGAGGGRVRDVVGVRGGSVGGEEGVDGGVAGEGVLEFLQQRSYKEMWEEHR